MISNKLTIIWLLNLLESGRKSAMVNNYMLPLLNYKMAVTNTLLVSE